MITNNLTNIISSLKNEKVANISKGNSDITIRFLEESGKLLLTTTVYFGGNFIPESVRKSLKEELPIDQQSIRTFLTIDEGAFRVSLNYLGLLGNFANFDIKEANALLEEFNWIADEWRYILDQRDRNDLIHIPAK
jgi:hypothetical protein